MRLRHAFALAAGAVILAVACAVGAGLDGARRDSMPGAGPTPSMMLRASPGSMRSRSRHLARRLSRAGPVDAVVSARCRGRAVAWRLCRPLPGERHPRSATTTTRPRSCATSWWQRGVPASAIELDHKGNRTWDSIVRARYGVRQTPPHHRVAARPSGARPVPGATCRHRGLGCRCDRRQLCRLPDGIIGDLTASSPSTTSR